METCGRCGAAMVYRFNSRIGPSAPASLYAYFCIAEPGHVAEDARTLKSA